MRVVLFFIFRAQFALACRLTTFVFRAGASAWVVNSLGRLLGTRWACSALFQMGWRGPA